MHARQAGVRPQSRKALAAPLGTTRSHALGLVVGYVPLLIMVSARIQCDFVTVKICPSLNLKYGSTAARYGVYYVNYNEYTQQVQQGHPRRARHPLALEGHRNPDRSATLAPLMELRSKRRLAHMVAQQ